jgi:hypothetical protein
MNTETMISASEFCIHHGIELTFIHSLKEYGLIDVLDIDDKPFLSAAELDRVEMFVRFHYQLDINLEGIETITHLLDRMKQMQEQITQLKNELGGASR